jgi:hypothetical protein
MGDGVSAMMHRATRPAWDCEDCGEPWPCLDRRAALLDEYLSDRLALLIFLAGLMLDALEDFHRPGRGTVPDLCERFLGWARRDSAGGSPS